MGAVEVDGIFRMMNKVKHFRTKNKYSELIKHWFKRGFPSSVAVWRGKSKANGIALTFDDGPHPEFSQRILDILKQEKVHATFFLIGSQVLKYPHIVKRIVEEGHEIGNHTFSHHSLKGLSIKEIDGEIRKTREILKNYCEEVTLIRPPWGTISLRLLIYVLRSKERLVLWSRDSGDSDRKSIPSNSLIKKVLQLPVRNGDIILFHEDYEHTSNSLQMIIRELNTKGFKLLKVTDIIDK